MTGNTQRLGIPRSNVVTFISSTVVLPLIIYTLSVFTANSQTGLESGNLSHIPPPGSISSLPLMSGLLTTSSLTNTYTTSALMVSTVLGMGTGPEAGHRLCTLCMGLDHWQAECALNSLEGHGNKSQPLK